MGRAMATTRNLPITVRDRTPITADRITSATAIGGITGNEKARSIAPGLSSGAGAGFRAGYCDRGVNPSHALPSVVA
jgi:hypothetical protein